MVIQRLQSLYLLIASVLMILFCVVVPVGTITGAEGAVANVYVYDNWTMTIIALVTAVLQLLTIFLYNNLKFQMKICLLSLVFVFFTIFICALVLHMFMDQVQISWLWPSVLTILSFVFTVMAYSRMKADYNLLRDSERMWR